MESSTLNKTAAPSTAFGLWKWEPKEGAITTWAVTPSHILFLVANAKKTRVLMEAIAQENVNAALAVKGVKSFPRNEISTIRFLPDTSRVHIVTGTKRTEHLMWAQAFAGIAEANPNFVPESEDFSSFALKASRFGGLLAVLGFLVLHWMAHNLLRAGDRANIIFHALRDVPNGAAYLLAAVGTAAAIGFGMWRNAKPTQAWVMTFRP